jgi:Transglycosylase
MSPGCTELRPNNRMQRTSAAQALGRSPLIRVLDARRGAFVGGRMRRLARWATAIVAGVTVLGLTSLELWYWSLLPARLPQKAYSPLPGLARWGLLAELQAKDQHQPILFPFLVTYFLYAPERMQAAAAAARVHLGDLLSSGELPRERTLKFQLRWLALTTWVARHWTVAESLDAYGASAWVGGEPRGLEPAALRLFGKPLRALDVCEMALLIGLLQSPSRLDPACYPERAAEARARILDRLVEHGRVSRGELETMKARPLGTVSTCSRSTGAAANKKMQLTALG